jgi:hypothetical protein
VLGYSVLVGSVLFIALHAVSDIGITGSTDHADACCGVDQARHEPQSLRTRHASGKPPTLGDARLRLGSTLDSRTK